jgi:5-methyltetrahydropteroyltriglutamate--homocysteine methyltransferase
MFATLAGAYPRTPLPGQPFRLRAAYGRLERGEIDESGFREVQDDLVRELLTEQAEAGLELLTDGQVRWDDPLSPLSHGLDGLEATGLLRWFDTNTYFRQPRALRAPTWRGPITLADWQFAAGTTQVAVKQCLVGPYTLGRLADAGDVGRETLTLAAAEALHEELRTLLEAGAPVVQVDEYALTLIGPDDDVERGLVREAMRRLTDGLGERGHLSLAVTMGDAAAVDAATLFDAPFRSYLFDLVAGPDNWRLVAEVPADRGVVAGVADARATRPDDLEVMVWAAHYTASTQRRGLERVGLAPSTGLEYLPRDRAKSKIGLLGRAARHAAGASDEAVMAAPAPAVVAGGVGEIRMSGARSGS